ncbi:signal peptide protein, partial [Intrasporangium oryzae NRRL B-24470]
GVAAAVGGQAAMPGGVAGPGAAGAAAPAQGSESGRSWGWSRGSRVPTTLVVTEGPLAGTSLPLRGGGILIGRNPECALVLDDDYASGRHCRIVQGPEGWVVEDLGSTNGTYIGRERLTTPRPVEVGTSLRIGKTVLELRG